MVLSRENVVREIIAVLTARSASGTVPEVWADRAVKYLRSCRRLYAHDDPRIQVLTAYDSFVNGVAAALDLPSPGSDPAATLVGLHVLSDAPGLAKHYLEADLVARFVSLFSNPACLAPGQSGKTTPVAAVMGLVKPPICLSLVGLRAFTLAVRALPPPRNRLDDLDAVTALWQRHEDLGFDAAKLAEVVAQIGQRSDVGLDLAFDLLGGFDHVSIPYRRTVAARLADACIGELDGLCRRATPDATVLAVAQLWPRWVKGLMQATGAPQTAYQAEWEWFRRQVGHYLFRALGHSLVSEVGSDGASANRSKRSTELLNACENEDFFVRAGLDGVIERLLDHLVTPQKSDRWHLGFTSIAKSLAGLLPDDQARKRVEAMHGYYVLRQAVGPRNHHLMHASILLRLLHGLKA